MGGRGTYSTGKSPEYTYESPGKIGNVKIIKPIEYLCRKGLRYKQKEKKERE